MNITQHQWVVALLFVISLSVTVEAQKQKPDDYVPYRPYDVLLVKPASGIQAKVVAPSTGEVVFTEHKGGDEHRYPVEAIEWALSKAHVTALVDGTFKLHNTLRVPVSHTSLIVGPNAELVVTDAFIPDAEKHHKPMIKVIRQDNVNVFNLGTLTADWRSGKQGDYRKGNGYGIWFDGRNGGTNGVDGGILFGTGTLNNMATGYWLIDTTNVKVPVIWSKNFWATVLGMEGNEDTEIGLAAGLRTENAGGANEVIDLNAINRRTRIHHLIGTWLDGQQELLDVNNSPETIVDELVMYGKPGQPKEELIGVKGNLVDIHAYGKGQGWVYTEKPYDNNNSPGTELKNSQIVKKSVKRWKTEVKTPGFPDSLPVLKIKLRLTAVFEDGSTEQVFSNKYRYDLTNAENPSGK